MAEEPHSESSESCWPFLAGLTIAVLYLYSTLLSNQFYITHEGIHQYIRTKQYLIELADGNFPPLLFNDAIFGGGFAFPVFYPPMSYLWAVLFSWISGDVGYGVNLGFLLPVWLSALTGFAFFRSLSGSRFVGFLCAILYITLPYRFVQVFARGALAELWSIVWLPLIFLGLLNLARGKRSLVLLPLSIAALLLSHTVISVYYISALYLLAIVLSRNLGVRGWITLVLSTIYGFVLAAFSVLPQQIYASSVWVSDKAVLGANIDAVEGHRVHFRQFFLSVSYRWYEGSYWDGRDGMSFELGLAHFVMLGLLLTLFCAWKQYSSRLTPLGRSTLITFFVMWVLSIVYMWHPKFFLKVLPGVYEYIQFPWRLIGLAGFFAISILAIILPVILQVSKTRQILIIVSIIAVGLVPEFQRDGILDKDNNAENLTTEKMTYWNGFRGYAEQAEYLPISFPIERVKEYFHHSDGEYNQYPSASGGAQVTQWKRQKPSRGELYATGPGRVVVPIIDYPFWAAYDDGHNPVELGNFEGFLAVDLPEGNSRIVFHRRLTWPFYVGYGLSAVAAIVLVIVFLRKRRATSPSTPIMIHSSVETP